MSSCSLKLFTRHSSWLLCIIVADLTAHARALNSLRHHTCFLSKLIFDSDLRIFLCIRMMDPGKKRMITLKKSERDRKKLNESILKKLKTLDAEVAGASIVSWFLHSFSCEPGITLSCSNGLWEPNSFIWSVWTMNFFGRKWNRNYERFILPHQRFVFLNYIYLLQNASGILYSLPKFPTINFY